MGPFKKGLGKKAPYTAVLSLPGHMASPSTGNMMLVEVGSYIATYVLLAFHFSFTGR